MPEQPHSGGFADQLGTVISTISSPPTWWLLLITGLLAVFIRFAGRWFWQANVLTTIVHEAAHALVSLLCGGGVRQIMITSPDSGVCMYRWMVTRGEAMVRSFAGYAMPALAGLGCAALLSNGYASWVLFAGALVMLAVLLVVRDGVSLLVVLIVGALFATVLWWGPLWLHLGLASLVMWLLLIGEIPGVWDLVRDRFSSEVAFETDDAWSLYCNTGLPAPVWFAAWYGVIGWCCWEAFWLLWPVA
ncbi:M50 family metallopeptidase [Saccharopolyspora hattusasensis]|uniref:M50 family metallopeptidase n=1 Tax=Saccharopolyspora hattusasensis TaxID=1128679 RepID=UPI003D96B968